MRSSLAARSIYVRLPVVLHECFHFWNPLILLVSSDKLLEGRLHEFNLPMMHASNATATGAAPTTAGIFSPMLVSCLLLIYEAGLLKMRFTLTFPLSSSEIS